jgi:hypothetical protein
MEKSSRALPFITMLNMPKNANNRMELVFQAIRNMNQQAGVASTVERYKG